jgi:C4-dicarboxylate-specific signal transduction histidine kinase
VFAFFSQWLPAGSTVTALRDAIYFTHHQHARPIAVLATWAFLLFVAWLWVSRRREARTTRAANEPLPRTLAAS